jgi:DNA-binding transcriptional LysR family regulator
MYIEIRHIKAFLAVASELHFGRAANRLHIAQPALSRTIQNLEAILDVQLLERSTRNVRLTAAGQLFRDQSAKVMCQIIDTIQATQRVGRGDVELISVGYVDAALFGPMPEIFRRLRRDKPAAELELSQLAPENILERLISRRIDFGFLWGPVKDIRLDAHCIQSEVPVVVMPVSHRLSLKSRIVMQDLTRERFIMCGQHGREALQRASAKSGFVPTMHQDVPSLEALLAFVGAESGVGICPASIERNGRAGVLTRPLVGTSLTFDLHCAWHKENTSQVIIDFVNLVTRYATSRPEQASVATQVQLPSAS